MTDQSRKSAEDIARECVRDSASCYDKIVEAIESERREVERLKKCIEELEVSNLGIQQGGRNIQKAMCDKLNELEAENKRLREALNRILKSSEQFPLGFVAVSLIPKIAKEALSDQGAEEKK